MNIANNYDDNDSENSELSETEERNLENIISIFPKREIHRETGLADKITFERVKALLSCPICLELFKDPVFVKECMHRFCKGCIEKIIRGNHKTCPTCRKAIGSKRELRSDISTVSMISMIFPNLKDYLERENDWEQELIKNTLKDEFIRNNTKKTKTHRKQAPEMPEMEEEAEIGDLRRKRRKPNPKKEINAQKFGEISHRIKTAEEEENEEKKNSLEDELEYDEDMFQYLSELHKQGRTIDDLVERTELLVTVKFEPLPGSGYLPPIEHDMVRTNSVLKISQLCGHVCREMNLKESKHKEKISLYIKTGDYVKIEHQKSLGDLLNQEWRDTRSVGVNTYIIENFMQEIIDKTYLKEDTPRILYYDLTLDDLGES